ncbi:MAG: ATP-dependent DNA helicase RecG [Coriobacteriales bacterium]|jgi:ATP-dependent DNA helicase RecG|nr:ATP-dependent DNA helicase RecG [Coriobacteriales bacterium]
MHGRSEQTQLLDARVEQVRFAHGKRLEGLHELGIFRIRDLFEHYPFRYDDFSNIMRIIDLPLGEKNAVLGRIHEAKGRRTARGGYLYEATITDSSGMLRAVWFNQAWLADTLTVGRQILLLGKTEHYNGFLSMASPLYTLVAPQPAAADTSPRGDQQLQQVEQGPEPVGIAPVYRANSKLSSNWLKRIVLEAHKLVPEPLDPLPPGLRIRRKLVSRQAAWQGLHMPPNNEELALAHRRGAYEQVFWTQLRSVYAQKQLMQGLSGFTHQKVGSLSRALGGLLPFTLTDSQQRALAEIGADLAAPLRMNRLLLGDVGSGKTVVALHALVRAAESGWQAAMMAPTEVLANQYAAQLGPLLDELGIGWALLTSAVGASRRQELYEQLRTSGVQLVFGTHALLEPDVVFKELSLIVIDEQHRFGVEQRNSLIAKSPAADFLSMTATPIPRSLALVRYGSIQASYLDNRPQKTRTTTVALGSSVAYKAYEAVREALARQEQAYIVCPLISAPEPADGEDIPYLDDWESFSDEPYIAAAEAELAHLRTQVFPERRIELLTSRVKSEEKQRIMAEFREGRVDILVSTTVIEVGVDVPNATVMLVLDADRFGLAQLHQLRGRVGRGTRDASCFLISHNPSQGARTRLALLQKYTDGLRLAEADLAMRSEGDIAGTRQHGAGSLSLINVIRDSSLIEAAHADARELLDTDPELALAEHRHLRFELMREGSTDSN